MSVTKAKENSKKLKPMQIGYALLTLVSTIILCSVIVNNGKYISSHTPSEHSENRDYYTYYMASEMAREGKSVEVYQPEKFDARMHAFEVKRQNEKWLYPPTFMPLISWLAYFNYFTGYVLWVVVQAIIYALAISGFLAKKPADYIFFLGVPSFAYCYTIGQVIVLFAAFVVIGYRTLETRPRVSGMMWGLACFKPSIILLVPFLLLAKKKYIVLVYMVLTILITVILSLVCYGTGPWLQLVATNRESYSHFIGSYDSYVGASMITINGMLLILGVDSWVRAIELAAMALFAIIFIFKHFSNTRPLEMADIAIIQFLTILASPYGFTHELILPLPFALYAIYKKFAETDKFDPVLIMCLFYFAYFINQFGAAGHLYLAPFIIAMMAFYLYSRVRGDVPVRLAPDKSPR